MTTVTSELSFTNLLTVNLSVVDTSLAQNFRIIADRLARLERNQTRMHSELTALGVPLSSQAEPGKDGKDGKGKDGKAKDGKETRESKEGKEARDSKDGKETKEGMEGKVDDSVTSARR
jgi:hypothetical protein